MTRSLPPAAARLLATCLHLAGFAAPTPTATAAANTQVLRLDISWGHHSATGRPFHVRLVGQDLTLEGLRLEGGEQGDDFRDGIAQTQAGGGDVDGISGILRFEPRPIQPITNAHSIWTHLFRHGDSGAAKRLQADPAFRPDPRRITLQLDDAGTRGFSLTVDQLLTEHCFWVPELDLFISAGDPPTSFATRQAELAGQRGQRVVDRVAREPEASYAQYASRWEDMGNPAFQNPHSVPPGHIVGLGWDGSLHKFGIDRLAGARNDYARADRFDLAFDFGDPKSDLSAAWKGQRLTDGLPILTTTFEKDGVRCEVEQFATPLDGPPTERRGDLKMVLLQRTRFTDLLGKPRTVQARIVHGRSLGASDGPLAANTETNEVILRDGSGRTLLVLDGAPDSPEVSPAAEAIPAGSDVKEDPSAPVRHHRVTASLLLPASGSAEFILRLPSPALTPEEGVRLRGMSYPACRDATFKFWNDLLSQGAFFSVPEDAVNTLFRASLWHALRLPRRHGGAGPDLKLDLPYSNFAYDQLGTPWPVNQSVYVDYMLYDLRGYHAFSEEEHAAMFRNNQEPSGHVGGFANWGVYSPGMLYSVSQHYLLSGDSESFQRLLPQTLRALDWCLAELKRSWDATSSTPGLVLAPLNDLSHDARSWAFNQAYFVAGLDLLGRALGEIQHPRAAECRATAQRMRAAVQREFSRASLRSPAVQLADGTWSPYVPSDAQASGRLFTSWYPTDVDTGPLHLARLKALDPRSPLTTAMLHDHEDNLFLNQWGMINEPVYNQQATTYLLRDEPKHAIRAFYSMMACAFSHSVFEPVEHRWGWGQYFGPPSTDGAWFELYRNLLIHERDDDSLVLAQATPRAWLEDGKHIEARRAPTYYGPLSFTIDSHANRAELTAALELPARRQPNALFLRFRHPASRPIRSVQVDGRDWTDFDVAREWVRIERPSPGRHTITARY